MRVLLIKTSSLGDVIHTLPALTDAQRAIPGIQFDWVVEEGFAEIPSWHPAVAEVIPVAIRRWRKHLWQTYKNGEWRALKQRIKQQSYDLTIDAQGLLKSAWLTRFNLAPVAGFDKQSAREAVASYFYDAKYQVATDLHAVERTRRLFALALGYSITGKAAEYGLQTRHKALAQPYVMFLHGTTWPSKHWPEQYWRHLAEQLNSQGIAVHLAWGNAAEQQRAERIAHELEQVTVLPQLNLAGVADEIANATACVAVDTGLGHLAAALDVPTISLYGPTLPGRVGAYGKGQIHLCAEHPLAGKGDRQLPCFDDLTPDKVLQHLQPLLQPTTGSAAPTASE